MIRPLPSKQTQTALTLIFLSLLLLSFTACSKAALTPEDMVYADVSFQMSQGDETMTLVSSTKDLTTLTGYLEALILADPIDRTLIPDLVYHLDLGTKDSLLSYDLSFNLANREAIAINESGNYMIPFEWLNDYLSDLPIETHLTYYAPPTFNLYIQDTDTEGTMEASSKSPHSTPYKIATAIQQEWFLQPTLEVAYPYNESISEGEHILRENPNFKLYADFSHNGPTSMELTLLNKADTTDNLIDSNDYTFKQPAPNATTIDALPTPKTPGTYIYRLDCFWDEPSNGYQGHIQYSFDLTIDQAIAYTYNKTLFSPGDCISLLVENAKDLDYRIETPTYDKTIALFYYDVQEEEISPSNPRDLVGMIPLDSRTVPGDYEVKIYKDSTDQLLDTYTYTVMEKEFNEQFLTVSTTTEALKSNTNYADDAAKFARARAFSVGEKLWEGTFMVPVEGARTSTEYATIRFVNGAESYRHNAIDLAVPQGTPIHAANNGIVTFADDLIISGNVVCLDHGYGLFSTYLHMYKIYVEEGQEVKKGDVIGEVGTTGFSTGPHLHWGLWKNGIFVNPWSFVAEDPLAAFEE